MAEFGEKNGLVQKLPTIGIGPVKMGDRKKCFGHINCSTSWTPATRMNENWKPLESNCRYCGIVGCLCLELLILDTNHRSRISVSPSATMGTWTAALFLVWFIPRFVLQIPFWSVYDIALRFESVAKHFEIQRPHTSCSLSPAPLQHPSY